MSYFRRNESSFSLKCSSIAFHRSTTFAVSVSVIEMILNACVPSAFVVDRYSVDDSCVVICVLRTCFIPSFVVMLENELLFAASNKHRAFQ